LSRAPIGLFPFQFRQCCCALRSGTPQARRPKHSDRRPRSGFARERVDYKAPQEEVFLDRMPLNATGKGDQVTLQQTGEARPGRELDV
jgi:hypothetical protein